MTTKQLTKDEKDAIRELESMFDTMLCELSSYISEESASLIREGQTLFTKELDERGMEWSSTN